MVKAQLFIIGCLARLTSASIADESVSLIQKDSRLKIAASASDSSCECLGWKDAYTKHGASCGDGHELDLAGIPGPIAKTIPQLSFEFCSMYFGNLPNDNYCMNKKWLADPTEWCYVPAGCTEGTPIQNRTLATKDCNKEADATLGEMKFEELAAYAYRNKLELGLMVQYAFPTWDGEKLPDVQAFWGLPAPADAKPISTELRERLEAQVKSGKTMFIVSRNGHPPFGVSEGEKLYYINFNPTQADFSHKEDMNLWGCVAGCGSENKALW
mmetsp:Transcript_3156/g.9456  ORF Transcript_3156/g.9456 Transcript_3156/m.9456 type:complete len:270 (-) Transcript_3156:132-941(-)